MTNEEKIKIAISLMNSGLTTREIYKEFKNAGVALTESDKSAIRKVAKSR